MQCFSQDWMKLAQDPIEWRHKEDFVGWALTAWRFLGDMHLRKGRFGGCAPVTNVAPSAGLLDGCLFLSAHAMHVLMVASPGVTAFTEEQLSRRDVSTTFAIVGDSQCVIAATNGEACVENASPAVHEALEYVTFKLLGLWEEWASPALPLLGWTLWRKRAFNAAADCLAGWSCDSRLMSRMVVGTLPKLLRRCWAWFDGSLRSGQGAIGAVIARWASYGSGPPDAVLLESQWLGDSHNDITLFEARALARVVTRLDEARKGAWPEMAPQADIAIIAPEILEWIARREPC